MATRMAHLFCELFYRARASRLNKGNKCSVPLTLVQLAEALGMGIATANRALQKLRASRPTDFRKWGIGDFEMARVAEIGRFQPGLPAHEETALDFKTQSKILRSAPSKTIDTAIMLQR